MKIGIDVRKLRDYGIGTHIKNIVLPAARISPHEFYLYCDPQDKSDDERNLIWVSETSSKYSLEEHFSLSKRTAEEGIELFHSPHYTLPLRLSCRSIVTIHDLIHLKFRKMFPFWKVKAAELMLKKAVSKADLILTVSKTSYRDIVDYFPEAQTKIEVIYNRISDAWLEPPPQINLSALGIPADFLLYVGNFKKHKGIDLLLQAFCRIKEKPLLLLVGNTGSMDSELAEKVFSTPNVRLMGFAEGALLHKLYSATMLFVFPSFYEGFGYPPLEAMACGAPVLSSDAPAMKEILGEGAEFFECGSVESLATNLRKLIQSHQRRSELKEPGRNRARFFASDESARRLAEIYERFSG